MHLTYTCIHTHTILSLYVRTCVRRCHCCLVLVCVCGVCVCVCVCVCEELCDLMWDWIRGVPLNRHFCLSTLVVLLFILIVLSLGTAAEGHT